MAATIGLVLDCADPHGLGEFWTSALGYRNAGAAGSYVVLVAPDGETLKLLLQAVAEHVPDVGVRSVRRHEPVSCG